MQMGLAWYWLGWVFLTEEVFNRKVFLTAE